MTFIHSLLNTYNVPGTMLDIKEATAKRLYPREIYILWGRPRTDINQIIQRHVVTAVVYLPCETWGQTIQPTAGTETRSRSLCLSVP